MKKSFIKTLLCFLALTLSSLSHATIVRIETSLGDIDVNLYDETTPESVANFLTYVDSGTYGSSLFHRSISGFILQGGGFAYNNTWPPIAVSTNVAVINEPIYSNVRGTIAYAKLGGDPNSATTQWFFNLADNSANLDNQNSGFTVFGEVVNNGMDVVDAIASLNTYNLGGAFTDIPLQNYTAGTDPNDTNIMLITNISVIDSSVISATGLNPPATTRSESTNTGNDSSSGGGLIDVYLILALLLLTSFRVTKITRKS